MAEKPMKEARRTWEYTVRSPMLAPGATSPIPGAQGYEWFLNHMDEHGWEYVGPAVEKWNAPDTIFTYFVFRRAALKQGA